MEQSNDNQPGIRLTQDINMQPQWSENMNTSRNYYAQAGEQALGGELDNIKAESGFDQYNGLDQSWSSVPLSVQTMPQQRTSECQAFNTETVSRVADSPSKRKAPSSVFLQQHPLSPPSPSIQPAYIKPQTTTVEPPPSPIRSSHGISQRSQTFQPHSQPHPVTLPASQASAIDQYEPMPAFSPSYPERSPMSRADSRLAYPNTSAIMSHQDSKYAASSQESFYSYPQGDSDQLDMFNTRNEMNTLDQNEMSPYIAPQLQARPLHASRDFVDYGCQPSHNMSNLQAAPYYSTHLSSLPPPSLSEATTIPVPPVPPPNAVGRANLEIMGNMKEMASHWSEEEYRQRRRLIQVWRYQTGNTIHCGFRDISAADYRSPPPDPHADGWTVVSCIYWEERNQTYITSVDLIHLLEVIMNIRFSVEEKNRVRRNLEGFRPQTVGKSKQDTADFFRVIMNFPHPKPRNIEKDVKVFPWHTLPDALCKIVTKYTASYHAPTDAPLQ